MAPANRDRRFPVTGLIAFAAVAIGGCAIDLWTKSWIFARLGLPDRMRDDQVIWIVPNVFSLTTSLNKGALFGMGQGWTMVFAAASIVAAVAIFYWLFIKGAARDWSLTLTLALISAGIAGNLYDRLGLPGLVDEDGQRIYAVRDWLHFKLQGVIDWPVFNVADCCLVCGAILLFWYVWSASKPPQEEENKLPLARAS